MGLGILNGQHLKKDGTPDRRFKENKATYSVPATPWYSTPSNSGTHLKKDGTPDRRYKENNPNYNFLEQRDNNGKIIRSEAAKNEFKRQTNYLHGRPGYVIDQCHSVKKRRL